jgi:protein TonB
MLCFSLGLHAAAFVFFKYSPTIRAAQEPEIARAFSLVNIALVEESKPAAPVPVLPAPVSAPPVIESEAAEIFIEVDEIIPADDENPVPALPETAVAVPAGSARVSGTASSPSAGNSALINAYVKQNYNYIQRRIRDRLRYPPEARRAGIQGQTEVIFTIHQNGTVSGAAIQLSSGNEILDQAALEAVYAAAPFRPSPAPARIVIPISFKLR